MYLLSASTIDCLYNFFVSKEQHTTNYLDKYKILKQNNLIVIENLLDKVVEIENYIIKYLDKNNTDKLSLILFFINNYSEYFKTLNLFDTILNYKETLINNKNVLIKSQIVEYLKRADTYIIMENIQFEDSFFTIFKNIETCLFILKNSKLSNDINYILKCNMNTIKNILFHKNKFYNSFYYDINKKFSGLKINMYKIFYLLLDEFYNVCNDKKLSSSIFNIHSFYISETSKTNKQFKMNLIKLYKCYEKEIKILQDVYDINLTKIIQKYVIPESNKYLIYLGILQNIIKVKSNLSKFNNLIIFYFGKSFEKIFNKIVYNKKKKKLNQ